MSNVSEMRESELSCAGDTLWNTTLCSPEISVQSGRLMSSAFAIPSCAMQDDSVEQQRQAIKKWAAENNFSILRWFEDEGKSGVSFDKRPGFQKLLHQVMNHPQFKYIIVYDESRWGRPNNPRENTYWKFHVERFGVRVRIINSGSRNENDIGSFVTEVVESAEASEYSKKLSRTTLRGSSANALRGFSSGGTAPYGYVRVAVDKTTGEKLRVLRQGEWMRSNMEKVTWGLGDALEVENVKKIFLLKASGYGYVTIADQLNCEGIPCPQRGRWRNKDQKWCQGTIRAIIVNKAYCGKRVYNKHPQSHLKLAEGKKLWINQESQWVIADNAHPAIISEELFNKANSSNRRRFASGSAQIVKSEYLLSGLMKCSHCGFNFSGQRYLKERVHYYQDSGYINKGRSVCSSYLIRKEKIEDFVVRNIKENLFDARSENRLREIIEERLKRRLADQEPALTQLEKAIDDTECQIRNLVDAIAKGINADTVIPRLQQLEAQKAHLRTRRQELGSFESKRKGVKDLVSSMLAEIRGFKYLFDQATTFEKKNWIRRFVRQITVDRTKNQIICQIMKIPMVSHTIVTSLLPSESSIIGVAGTGTLLHLQLL